MPRQGAVSPPSSPLQGGGSVASGRQETETSPKVPLPPKIGCFRRLLRKTQQQQQGGRFSSVFCYIFNQRKTNSRKDYLFTIRAMSKVAAEVLHLISTGLTSLKPYPYLYLISPGLLHSELYPTMF